jgi:hypothetical protein
MMYISSTRLRNISHLRLMSWWLKSYSCFLKIFKCFIIIKLRSIEGSIPINFSSSDSFSFNLNLRSKHAKRCCKYVHFIAHFSTLLHTFLLYCTRFPESSPWMSGTCMDSILQIHSNLSHPASHCCKCARYDFSSTVASTMPGILSVATELCYSYSRIFNFKPHCFTTNLFS